MTSLLGTKLPEAEKKIDLFTWFGLTKVDEAPSNAGALVFRPNGPAFQKLVKLELMVAPDETIKSASLHVLRGFITRNSANAGDLVKSFVQYGNDPGAGALANEIMLRSLAGSLQPVITRGDMPKASGPPSLAFRIFSGEAKRLTLGNLTLEHRLEGIELALVLTLSEVAPPPKGWFARLFRHAG